MRVLTITLFLLVALSLGACRSAPADKPPAPASTATTAPASPPEPLSFGRHHHPIRTSNAEAQKMFDQGLAQAFGFNHEAAIRSFERAAELDPFAPMPHWGKAWALGPNYNLDIDDARAKTAYETLAKAKSLLASAPPDSAQGRPDVERDYIEALEARYSADPTADRAQLARAFSRAMGDLARRYPDDLDAAVIHAESLMNLTPWKLWTPAGTPASNTELIVGVLESVMLRNPNHLGANHYYIHAVEASRTPARALPSAQRLSVLAESSGHLLHMPAHIYARTGDHTAAASANAAGAAADRRYLISAPANGMYGMMYYPHNLHFLADSHMMQGRFSDAKQAADRVAEQLTPHAAMMPMVESMIVMPVSVLMRFSRHADVLALQAPPPERSVQGAWHHFARGTALARTGKIDEADAERKLLTAAIAAVPETAAFGGGGWATAASALSVAALSLDARIAGARGEHDQAIKYWQQAVAAADQLPYDEPPVWFYPVRESLGAAFLAAGRDADAERVFRDDLVKHPRNARSLFGLQAALTKQGKDVNAMWVQREFNDAWKNADVKLTPDDF
jgi:tetratricopeptide (TPR) repeat protein